jgi:hypothetical protein
MGDDCSGVLKTRNGKSMDGWANIDPPAQSQPPFGIEGPSSYDNVGGGEVAGLCSSETPVVSLPHKRAHWQLTGPGIAACTTYRVTIHFTGVVECRMYASAGCARAAQQGRDAKYDLSCKGAADDPAFAPEQHKRYFLSVTPAVNADRPLAGEPDAASPPGEWWALNECPEGETESAKTWMIDFEKTIDVPAGWWINFAEFAPYCRELLNCGNSNDSAASCANHYMLTPSGAVPPPPASIATQPAAAGAGSYGQWIYFDVKSVVPR